MLKGVVFDFDGTLFDSMYIWETVGEEYLRSLGKEPEADLQKTLKTMSLRQASEYVQKHYQLPLTVQEIMDGVSRTVEGFYFHTVQPKKGVPELLEQLKTQGVQMCIATATEKYQVEAALKRCGVGSYFSEIFTCTDVGHGKDEPIIFRRAMEHLGTTKADTIVFEDSYHAAKTAKEDGFFVVSVFDSFEKRQAELQEISDCFIKDFTQIESFWKFAYGL